MERAVDDAGPRRGRERREDALDVLVHRASLGARQPIGEAREAVGEPVGDRRGARSTHGREERHHGEHVEVPAGRQTDRAARKADERHDAGNLSASRWASHVRMRREMRAHEPSAGLWDVEWRRAWKAHPANVWFDYEASVYLDRVGAIDGDRPLRALKTDAFDEACGRRQLTAGLGDDVVVVDVAASVVRHALRPEWSGLVGCAADVRALPFRSGVFDLVLSTSTLDHFQARGDIDVALRELRRVLRDDGRLFVTLDNPANPILRVRQVIYGVTGAIAGLIPFRMGLTLSREALVAALERTGFEVGTSGYLVHAPRVVALWAGERAARRGDVACGRRLGAALRAIERAATRGPLARWSAHFIFAECRPRRAGSARTAEPGPVAEVAAPRSPAPRWLREWKQAELRLRATYLRTVPRPVLAVIDPPLRRAAAAVRCVAAVPLYLRQPLTRWTGPCDREGGRVVVWGARESQSLLLDALFDEPPVAAPLDGAALPEILRAGERLAAGADVLVAHTTPALTPWFRRAGFRVVPGMVRFGGETTALLAGIASSPRVLDGDLRRLRRSGHRIDVWSYTPERSRLFYERYLVPHTRARFGAHAEIPMATHIDQVYRAGSLLAVTRRGATEPDGLALVVERGDVLWCVLLGLRDGDPAPMRTGAMAAVYRGQIERAHAQGLSRVDFGRVRPWAADGVYRYKWKWGLRPVRDGAQTLEFAVKVLRPGSALAARLVCRGVVVRDGNRYRTFTPDDLNAR